MEEKNKDIEVIAYKGIELDMSCGDFQQYEIGKTYKTDKAKLWKCGFHACLNPIDVLGYYKQSKNSRYFKVKLFGEITKCDEYDTKVAATEITILEEINIDEVIETTEWWKHDNVLDLLYWSDGLARVQRGDNLYNFINKNGNYLFTKWFYWLGNFKDGFARVARTNGECNFIDKKGDYLSDEWFYYLENFQDGFAKVKRRDSLWNFIDKNGNYLSKEWFDYVYYFQDRFAKVQRTSGEQAKIDKNGKIVSE